MKQAESDLEAAALLSGAKHHSQAIFLAAQAVEKGHKAILAALGLRYEEWHYKRLGHNTGDIANLLPEALHEPTNPQIAQMVTELEARAGRSRYPSPDAGAGNDDGPIPPAVFVHRLRGGHRPGARAVGVVS